MLSSQLFIICAALFARGFAVLDSDDDTMFIQHRPKAGIETDEHATWEALSNLATEADSNCTWKAWGPNEECGGFSIKGRMQLPNGATGVIDTCQNFCNNYDHWRDLILRIDYDFTGKPRECICATCLARRNTTDQNEDMYFDCIVTASTPAPTNQPVLADAMPLTLETNSLGGDGGLLRFSNIALDGTELVVENTTEYIPFQANVTGLAAPMSSLAQISLGCGDTVEMKFEFIIDSQPVIPSAFNFTVADLDKGAKDRCSESVEMSDWNAISFTPTKRPAPLT